MRSVTRVEAAYRRGDLFEKRRRLTDAWAEFCSRVPKAGAVIRLSHVAQSETLAHRAEFEAVCKARLSSTTKASQRLFRVG